MIKARFEIFNKHTNIFKHFKSVIPHLGKKNIYLENVKKRKNLNVAGLEPAPLLETDQAL